MMPNSYFRTQMINYSSKYTQDLQDRYKTTILNFSEHFDEIPFPEIQYIKHFFVVKKPYQSFLEKTGEGAMYQAHTKELAQLDRQKLPNAFLFTGKKCFKF